jgi:hypothetical protein
MAINRRKKFADYSAQLEAMADGIKKHKADVNFPSQMLNESEVRTLRKALEALREDYEKKETEARISHEKYIEKLEEAKGSMNSLKMVVKANYGKKNPVLSDYGIAPEKPKKRKKKEEETKKEENKKEEK